MKTLLWLLFFSLFCVNVISQDIRNVSWGMTPAMVQQIEPNAFFKKLSRDKNNTMIVYKDFILGDSVYVWYQFLYDSLASVTYQLFNSSIFEESYSDMLKYVESLTIKYGDPIYIKWDCRDPKSKHYVEIAEDKNSEFSYNFYTGDITRITYRWETQTSSIVLLISSTTLKVEGRDFKTPEISVLYRTLNFESIIKKAQSEYINEKL